MEREPEREPECGPSHVPWPQPDSWFADKVEDVPQMQATQAPQPEAEFQEVIEVEEEDEPAPKRKKVTSVAAREWEHNFALLEAFRRREGHADVPPGHKVGGTALLPLLPHSYRANQYYCKTCRSASHGHALDGAHVPANTPPTHKLQFTYKG